MKLPNQPRVLAATYNPVSKTKMISFLVDIPTVLLAELRTHKILTQGNLYEHSEHDTIHLSANSARAISTTAYLQKVMDNPFIPIWTGKARGMSGSLISNSEIPTQMWLDYLKGCESKMAIETNANTTIENVYLDIENINSGGWIVDYTKPGVADMYSYLLNQNIHKQNANRLLAPWAYTTCIISATEYKNFFELRCPKYSLFSENMPLSFKSKKAFLNYVKTVESEEFKNQYDNLTEKEWQEINTSPAQPEFQVISEMLYDLYNEAEFKNSEWHIPFLKEIEEWYGDEITSQGNDRMRVYANISASLCAKLSYDTQTKPDTLQKHIERSAMLFNEKHFEPFSHQAKAMGTSMYNAFKKYEVKNTSDFGLQVVETQGVCQTLTGFINYRYMLENGFFN